jgi:hypothetical protein
MSPAVSWLCIILSFSQVRDRAHFGGMADLTVVNCAARAITPLGQPYMYCHATFLHHLQVERLLVLLSFVQRLAQDYNGKMLDLLISKRRHMDGRGRHAREPTRFRCSHNRVRRHHFRAVTCGSEISAEEPDLFDSLIAKAARDHM